MADEAVRRTAGIVRGNPAIVLVTQCIRQVARKTPRGIGVPVSGHPYVNVAQLTTIPGGGDYLFLGHGCLSHFHDVSYRLRNSGSITDILFAVAWRRIKFRFESSLNSVEGVDSSFHSRNPLCYERPDNRIPGRRAFSSRTQTAASVIPAAYPRDLGSAPRLLDLNWSNVSWSWSSVSVSECMMKSVNI